MIGLINKFIGILGYKIVSVIEPHSYIKTAETVRSAQSKCLSVCDYVESIWDQKGCTDKVIANMKKAGCLCTCNRVCEIGPGTGRYLERVLKEVDPKIYDIYETADDWATYLESEYTPYVIKQLTDGRSLKQTPKQSCGLVHAHGVFVYLSFLTCFEYFSEMIRICEPGGYIVFDFLSDEHFNMEIIKLWITSNDRYYVILPQKRIIEYFKGYGFDPVSEFKNKYGLSFSSYIVFQNKG